MSAPPAAIPPTPASPWEADVAANVPTDPTRTTAVTAVIAGVNA